MVSVEQLARSLAQHLSARTITSQANRLGLSPGTKARYFSALWEVGKRPAVPETLETAERLNRQHHEYPKLGTDSSWAVSFCELAAAQKCGSDLVSSLLYIHGAPKPEYLNLLHPPSEWDLSENYELLLRSACLLALLEKRTVTIDDFIPDRIREESDFEQKEERSRYRDRLADLIIAYDLRARAILHCTTLRDLDKAIRPVMAKYRSAVDSRWRRYDSRYRIFARTVTDAIARLRGDGSYLISELADLAEGISGPQAPHLYMDMATVLLRYDRYRTNGYGLVERAVQFVKNRDMPASERTETLLRATQTIESYDRVAASDYFHQGMEAAEGLDDEGVRLLRVHNRLAYDIAEGIDNEPATLLAERLSASVERYEPHVSDKDLLPYLDTLEAVTTLCPAAGLALLCRWDDEQRIAIQSGIVPVVKVAVNSEYIDPRDGVWLLRLAGEDFDISDAAIPLLDCLSAAGVKKRTQLTKTASELSDWISRDLPIGKRKEAAEKMLSWLENNGMNAVHGASELRELAVFMATLPGSASWDQGIELLHRKQPQAGEQENLVIEIGEDVRELDSKLRALISSYRSEDIEAFLVDAAKSLGGNLRLDLLDAVVGLPSGHPALRYNALAITRALRFMLTNWQHSKTVVSWANEGIGKFVDKHFKAIVGDDFYGESALRTLFELPFVDNRQKLLLRGISRYLDELSSNQLYRIAEGFAPYLAENELHGVLNWSLLRLQDSLPCSISELPSNSDEALASFIWTLLGNVDKRVRWRCAHAARAILSDKKPELVAALIGLLSNQGIEAFNSPRLLFYWMSARLWLLLVLARVADEQPNVLKPHVEALCMLALDPSFPHASARELAKRAALLAAGTDDKLLDGALREKLNGLNQPSACFVNRGFRDIRKVGRDYDRKDSRFNFDEIDTLPYWYEPFARIFGLETADIASRAEVWIVDRYGFTDKDVWEDRRELRNEHSWQKMSNRHGSFPVLENMRHYLEYHALQLVAGQLIDERAPMVIETWSDTDNPWLSWLLRHLETSVNWWLADLRSPTPLDPRFFGYQPEHWKVVHDQDFDRELGFEIEEPEQLVASARISVSSLDRDEEIIVSSALVTPEMAQSLMRALQTIRDPHDYSFPDQGEGMDNDRLSINEDDFQLVSWLRTFHHDSETIEEFDPLRRIEYSYCGPGTLFETTERLSPDSRGLELRALDGKAVSSTRIWSDRLLREEEYERKNNSRGYRTTVSLDAILDFLQCQDRDLIIKVAIERHANTREEHGHYVYEPGNHRVYLISRDGRLQTLAGSRKIR